MADERPRRRTPRDILRALRSILGRESERVNEHWPDGCLPPGDAIVIADGLASRSYSLGEWTSWLEILRPLLAPGIAATTRGFSYSLPCAHYGPKSTDRTIDSAIVMSQNYVRFGESHAATTYVGFSLGAALLLVGVGERLEAVRGDYAALIPCVILLQPALAIHDEYADAAQAMLEDGEDVPAILVELLESEDETQDRMVQAARALVNAGTRVVIIYWAGDEFLAYPTVLLQRLSDAGVTILSPLNLSQVNVNPFVAHCEVSRRDEATAAICRAITACADDDWSPKSVNAVEAALPGT